MRERFSGSFLKFSVPLFLLIVMSFGVAGGWTTIQPQSEGKSGINADTVDGQDASALGGNQNLSEVLGEANKAGTHDINLTGNAIRDVSAVYDDSNTQCGSDEFLNGQGSCTTDSFATDTDNQNLEDVLAQYNDAGAYNINLSGSEIQDTSGPITLGGGNVEIPDGKLKISNWNNASGLNATGAPNDFSNANDLNSGGTVNHGLGSTLDDGNTANQNIDLNENNITNIDSLLDSTGSKTINFDGSNNIEIPNGNLDIGDGTGSPQIFLNGGSSNFPQVEWQDGGTSQFTAEFDASNNRLVIKEVIQSSEDVARFKNGGSVEIPNGNLRVDKAVELSDMGFGNSWGGIKNKDVADSDYALLQKDNGQTLINTDGGNFIKFKEDDSTVRMSLDANNNVEIPNGNLDMSGNDLKNVDDVKNFTATNMFRNGDIEDSHTSNFGGDAYRTSNEAYKGTYSMVGGDSDFGQYVGAWIVRDHTTGEFKENESYTLYYYAKNTDDNERTYGFAGCGGMAVHTIPANSGWQLYRETFQIPENCGYPSAGKGETRFQVRDSHTWNGKVYFDNIVLVKGETKQDEFLPHPQDPIDNGASLDLSESELQNVDGIQDGSGTNTIHFDGSNNVDIPNGNLKVAGSAGTSSTTSGLTIDGQRNVEFLTSGSRDFRLYNHGGRITFEDSDEELLDINENGPVEIPNGNLNLGSFPQPGSDSMCWDGSGASNIGDCSSLRKYKNNITDLGLGLETVNAMQPRRFVWDKNMSGEEDIGFVAEEVENVNPIIADYNGDNLSGVKYRQYTAVLTNAVQTLDDRNEELKQENKEQEERISELESEMEELERENEKMKEVLCEMKPGAEFCG